MEKNDWRISPGAPGDETAWDEAAEANLIARLKETGNYIRRRTNIVPDAAIILGSGLGGLAESSVEDIVFNYNELPNFTASTVSGHAGMLMIGRLAEKNVAVMQGRLHYYEGYDMEQVIYPVRLLKSLGAKTLIITSACGAVNPKLRLHDIVILKDHMNFMGANPLRGRHYGEFGERFPDMSEVYSSGLRSGALKAARKLRCRAYEGVYAAVSGPTYETPAEIRAYRKLGCDLIGMSVVPEAVAARQMGMNVLGICYIANTAGRAGAKKAILHQDVLKVGAAVSEKIGKIIASVIANIL